MTNATVPGDGRFVVFDSGATNLVDDDRNGATDIFFHDRYTGRTMLVSRHTDGTQGNNINGPALGQPLVGVSAHGEVVVFASTATNLIEDDLNRATDIFAHTPELVSLSQRILLPGIFTRE